MNPAFAGSRKSILVSRGVWDAWSATTEAYRRQRGLSRDEAAALSDADFNLSRDEIEAHIPQYIAGMHKARAEGRRRAALERNAAKLKRRQEGKEIAIAHEEGRLVIGQTEESVAEEVLKKRSREIWRKKREQKAGVDDYDAIRWVADVFADDDIGRSDAPSDMAWSLLTFARSSPSNTAMFWGTLFKSVALPKRSDIEEMHRNRSGTRHITEAIEECRTLFVKLTGTSPVAPAEPAE